MIIREDGAWCELRTDVGVARRANSAESSEKGKRMTCDEYS